MLSVNCNFEHSLCGWDQVSEGDDIDWIRGSPRTESDHTYGNSSKVHWICSVYFPVFDMDINEEDRLYC